MSKFWQSNGQDATIPRYTFGTRRYCTPAETLKRIRPMLSHAGITRLADITGLDWIGVPVYQAIRPNSRNVSVSLGKGLTRSQAQVSALMESLEGFHAEEILAPVRRATVTCMRQDIGYDPYSLSIVAQSTAGLPRALEYDPYAPPVSSPSYLNDHISFDWVAASDLLDGTSSWVPRQLCQLNFCVEERIHVPLFRATSNGLASGNTAVEAIIHGLCEVIERDALWRIRRSGISPDNCIAVSTITSSLAHRILDRFDQAGAVVRIVDVSGPTELPCFHVFLDHPESAFQFAGSGCHPSRTTALLRALTEAAQTRLAYIAGSRDDFYRRHYRDAQSATIRPSDYLPKESRRNFQSTPSLPNADWNTTLTEIASRVRRVTGMSPLVVDLARPDFGLPVVYVVAPGLRLDPPKRR